MTAPNRYAIDPGAPVTAPDSDQDGLTDEFERLAGTGRSAPTRTTTG